MFLKHFVDLYDALAEKSKMFLNTTAKYITMNGEDWKEWNQNIDMQESLICGHDPFAYTMSYTKYVIKHKKLKPISTPKINSLIMKKNKFWIKRFKD